MKEKTTTFKGKRIGVIGDVMLDRFIWGVSERVSPEAPVPVVLSGRESISVGGAANVARNVASLGGTAALVGVVGDDVAGGEFRTSVQSEYPIDTAGVLSIPGRMTTEKTRVMLHGKQVVRVDREVRYPLESASRDALLEHILRALSSWDAVVISDYAKGVVDEYLITRVVAAAFAHGIPIIADMKPKHIPLSTGVTILTSNAKEVVEAAGVPEFREAARALKGRLRCSVLVTKDTDGLFLFEGEGETHIPHAAKEVVEVSGAGDTVTAGVALACAAGLPTIDAVRLANVAAGIVVGKAGVATVSSEELAAAL